MFDQKYIMGRPNRNPYWETWLADSTENELSRMLIERYMIRPNEELYDLENDVYKWIIL